MSLLNVYKQDIEEVIVDNLEDFISNNQDIDSIHDIHDICFNEDYFIVGYYKAEEWLKRAGIFKCINYVQSYEQDTFGCVITDLTDSEKVANMLAYILGEESLFSLETDMDDYDSKIEFIHDLLDEIKGN